MVDHPIHSPLGASSAERWMNCPGSIALLKLVGILIESDEPEYRADGTAAHEAAALCLRTGMDAWEIAGQKFFDRELDMAALSAVQLYLDTVRALAPGRPLIVEYSISSPIHPLFYGTVDCAIEDGATLYVNDYKHGEGLAVDVEFNPQVMYYGYGLLEARPSIERIVFRIIQPRSFHPSGPVREWSCSADYLRSWAADVLVPAMLRTELDDTLDAGPWCRFCPAKLVCPLLTGLFGAASKANSKDLVNLDDAALGLAYQYSAAVKFYLKALEGETFARLNAGREVPNTKLVYQKTNRVWKKGAEARFKDEFGAEAFTAPEFRSPADMESIGEKAKNLVHEWAYQPQAGLTVALASDKKPGIKMKTSTQAFAGAVANLGANDAGEDTTGS